jgi:iron(III) transport system substrate-binding protein
MRATPLATRIWLTAVLTSAAWASSAAAQSTVVLYCADQEERCRALSAQFEKESGIKVAMTRRSSGETLAQVKAEAANPKGDVWWGGTGDPQLQAAEEGLTDAYDSPMVKELHDWAQKVHRDTKGRAIGVYTGALGFGFNTKQLAAKGIPEPKCWADLLDPKLKDDVQVADPNSSGTSYTLLATVVQLMGEDKGFAYMKALHKNINQYTKSGAAPAKATALGETTVGITFQHDMVVQIVDGAPIKVVSPCEGTGYEVGTMSIIKGSRNLDAAKKFYDWVLTPAAQKLLVDNKAYQVQSNRASVTSPQAPKLSELKLITYDFAKYGSAAERKRLLTKWDAEVKPLPK